MKKFIYIILAFTALYSCEEVITLDLGEHKTKLVIEATVEAPKGECNVRISTSTDYYRRKPITVNENAKIELTIENTDKKFEILHKGDGVYSANVDIEYLSNYHLKVVVDGDTIKGTSFLNKPVEIDTVEFRQGFFEKKDLFTLIKIKDHQDTENFYRAKQWNNDETESAQYHLEDDEFTDEGKLTMAVFIDRRGDDKSDEEREKEYLKEGDNVKIQVMSLDEVTYDYFGMLSQVLTKSFDEPDVPANPTNNFDKEVFGYFGVYSVTETNVVVPGGIVQED